MQLEAVTVGPYRQVDQVTIRTEGPVVLYGPNGAGKTAVLRALAGREAVPPAADCTSAPTFYLRLANEDRPILVRLLARAGATPVFRAISEAMRLEPERVDFYTGLLEREKAAAERTPDISLPDLSTVAEPERELAFVSALLADVSPQGRTLAEPFVWELLLQPRLAVCEARVWLAASPSMWSASALVQVAGAAALRNTWVQKIAQTLCASDEPCPVVRLGSDASLQPHILWLDGSDGDLGRELEQLMPQLHDAYWGVRAATAGSALSWSRAKTPHAAVDPWIEAADDKPQQGDAFAQAWLKPRQSLAPVLAYLEARIATLVPYFVELEGGVKLRLQPIPRWPSGRLQIVLAAPNQARPLAPAELSVGARRWVAIAVRTACQELLRSAPRQVVNAATGKEYVAPTRYDDVMTAARQAEPGAKLQVRSFFPPADSILVLDGPEAHLHALGVRDVVDIVDAVAPNHLATFVASHAPEFLNRYPNLQRVDRDAASGRTLVRPIGDKLLAALREMAGAMGLELADVLGANKALLLVGDKQDEMVIKHLFRRELEHHRVLVLPLASVDNAVALAEGDFVYCSGLHLFALVDAATREALAGTAARIPESDALFELLRRVANRDDVVTRIPFNAPDTIVGLPEAAVRRAFPKAEFKGWSGLDKQWRERTGRPRDFKQFVIDQMKLAPMNVPRFILTVLQARQDGEPAGAEVGGAVTALLGHLKARPVVAPPAGSELERRAAEQRADAERRAELARRAEERRAEARRLELKKQAEAEAARHAEAERLAEIERRAEADRQRRAEAVQRAEAEAARRVEAEKLAAAETELRAEAERRVAAEVAARAEAEKRAEEALQRAAAEAAARVEAEKLAAAEVAARAEAEKLAAAAAEQRAAADAAAAEQRAAADAAAKAEAEKLAAAEAEKLAAAIKRAQAEIAAREKAEVRAAAEAAARVEAEKRTEAEAAARAEAEAEVRAEAERRAAAERRAEAEAEARAQVEQRAAAEAEGRAGAERRADAELNRRTAAEQRAEAEVQRRAEAEKRAEAEIGRRTEAERKAAAEAEARAKAEQQTAAEVKRRTDAERRAKAEAEARVEAERLAAAEAELRVDLEVRAEAEVMRRVHIELGRRAELERRAELRRREGVPRRAAPEPRVEQPAPRGLSEKERLAEAKRREDAELLRRAEAEVDRRTELERRAEAEARRAEAEAARRAEAEAARRAEAAMARRADAEAKAARRAEAEAARRAETEAEAARRAEAEAEEARRAEAEAKRRAEEARRKPPANAPKPKQPKPQPPAKERKPADLWEAVDLFPPAEEIPDW